MYDLPPRPSESFMDITHNMLRLSFYISQGEVIDNQQYNIFYMYARNPQTLSELPAATYHFENDKLVGQMMKIINESPIHKPMKNDAYRTRMQIGKATSDARWLIENYKDSPESTITELKRRIVANMIRRDYEYLHLNDGRRPKSGQAHRSPESNPFASHFIDHLILGEKFPFFKGDIDMVEDLQSELGYLLTPQTGQEDFVTQALIRDKKTGNRREVNHIANFAQLTAEEYLVKNSSWLTLNDIEKIAQYFPDIVKKLQTDGILEN